MNIISESYLQYPPLLHDNTEIAEYIANLASDYVDPSMIEDHYINCHAVLRLLPIGEIKEGHPDGNARSVRKEKKYAKMDPATIPPLVVEDGEIADGNHRYRVAVANGATQLWCYCVEED